jgi:large subunit ribosomal protein L35
MPKMKRNSGAKKKFKLTGTGKLLRRRAGQSHNLEHKSPKLKQEFRSLEPVAEANDRMVRTLLGVKKATRKKTTAEQAARGKAGK